MKKIFFILFLYLPVFALGQNIQFFGFDYDNYPKIKAKYIIFDDEGQLLKMNRSELKVSVDNQLVKQVKITEFEDSKVRPVSVVLVLDVSGSMDGENMEMAKEAARQFIMRTPLYLSEIAVMSFDHQAYMQEDFSQNQSDLITAVDNLDARGGTEYNEAFMNTALGAVRVAKRGDHDKVIIFITDGLGYAEAESITKAALKEKITIFTVSINMPMPQSLGEISKKTKGKSFDYISNSREAINAYMEILQIVEKTSFGDIEWELSPTCNKTQRVHLDYQSQVEQFDIEVPDSVRIRPVFSSSFNDFGMPDTALTPQDMRLKVTARNGDFVVDSMLLNNKEAFSFESNRTAPFTLKQDSVLIVNIKYTPPTDSFYWSRLRLVSEACSNAEVFLQAGDRNKVPANLSMLKVVYPNGGEQFSPGEHIEVKWKSANKMSFTDISFSSDGGETYDLIGVGSGSSAHVIIPGVVSDSCIVKVAEQSNARISKIYPLIRGTSQINRSHDNSKLLLTSRNRVTLLTKEYTKYQTLYDERESISKSMYSHDGSLVAVSAGNIIYVYDEKGQEVSQMLPTDFLKFVHLKGHKKRIQDIVITPDNSKIISVARDDKMITWDVATGELLETVKLGKGGARALLINAKGDTLMLITKGKLLLMSPTTGEVYKIMKARGIGYFRLTLEKQILLCYKNKLVVMNWMGEELQNVKNEQKGIRYVDYSPDTRNMITVSSKAVKIWKRKNLDFIRTMPTRPDLKIVAAVYDHSQRNMIEILNGNKLGVVSFYETGFYQDISNNNFSVMSVDLNLKPITFKPVFVNRTLAGVFKNEITNKNSKFTSNVTSIQIHGKDSIDFHIVSGHAPYTIAANTSKNLELAFRPSSKGLKTAELWVVTPAKTFKTIIAGIGIPEPFRVTNSYVYFGKTKPKHAVTKKSSVVENISNENLKVVYVEVLGKNDGQIRLPKKLIGKEILPGRTLDFKSVYNPNKRGLTTLTINIYFENIDFPASVTFVGECIAPKYMTVKGNVKDLLTDEDLVAMVVCFDNASGHVIRRVSSKADGNYSIAVPIGRACTLQAIKKGYKPEKAKVEFMSILDIPKERIPFKLSKLDYEQGEIIATLNFTTGAYQLTTEGQKKLKNMLAYLAKNKDVHVQISGHTDNEGTQTFNQALSEQRAKSVRNYFVRHGINTNRLSIIGYSLTQPLAPNDTEDNRLKNRRAEIMLQGTK